jgi:hypothetical protein
VSCGAVNWNAWLACKDVNIWSWEDKWRSTARNAFRVRWNSQRELVRLFGTVLGNPPAVLVERFRSWDNCAENSPPYFKAVCKHRKERAPDLLRRILVVTASWKCFSLESTVRLCGMVSRQSCKIWVPENPHAFPEYEGHSPKWNLLCVLSRHTVIWSFIYTRCTVHCHDTDLFFQIVFYILLQFCESELWTLFISSITMFSGNYLIERNKRITKKWCPVWDETTITGPKLLSKLSWQWVIHYADVPISWGLRYIPLAVHDV